MTLYSCLITSVMSIGSRQIIFDDTNSGLNMAKADSILSGTALRHRKICKI